MSKIYVASKGKIIGLEKPIVSKTRWRIKKQLIEIRNDPSLKKQTFACAWTGFHTEATMKDVKICEESLEETYHMEGAAAWCDLWSGINDDFFPTLSVAGGMEYPMNLKYQLEKLKAGDKYVEPPLCFGQFACAFGWSKEYERQCDNDDVELKFENIWDEDNNCWWIISNLFPVIGYNLY